MLDALLKSGATDGTRPLARSSSLYDDVLNNLPNHIHLALENAQTKPCQFVCLITGLRDASVTQSEILNKLGLQHDAFSILNQTYALFQFLQLESHELIERVGHLLGQQSEDLLATWRHFALPNVMLNG